MRVHMHRIENLFRRTGMAIPMITAVSTSAEYCIDAQFIIYALLILRYGRFAPSSF